MFGHTTIQFKSICTQLISYSREILPQCELLSTFCSWYLECVMLIDCTQMCFNPAIYFAASATLFDRKNLQECSWILSHKSVALLAANNLPHVLQKTGQKLNPILHGLNPCVVSMSDFCVYLAWPHFFSGIPRNFLMVSKQLHIRALSKCSFNFQPNSSVAVRMMNSFFERS